MRWSSPLAASSHDALEPDKDVPACYLAGDAALSPDAMSDGTHTVAEHWVS